MVFKKVCLFLALVTTISTSASAIESSSGRHLKEHKFEPLKTKLVATAIHDFQVKRLKKMLNQRKISSDQFFSKIEGLIQGKQSKR